MNEIITYLLNNPLVFTLLLNVVSTVMLCGLLKAILKQIPKLENSNWRRIIQMSFNIVCGGILGYLLYSFETLVNILLGASCGFFSAVVYKIGIKKIYDKFGVNADSSFPPDDKE